MCLTCLHHIFDQFLRHIGVIIYAIQLLGQLIHHLHLFVRESFIKVLVLYNRE